MGHLLSSWIVHYCPLLPSSTKFSWVCVFLPSSAAIRQIKVKWYIIGSLSYSAKILTALIAHYHKTRSGRSNSPDSLFRGAYCRTVVQRHSQNIIQWNLFIVE